MQTYHTLATAIVLSAAGLAIAQPVAIDTFGPGNGYNAAASHPIRGFSSASGTYISNGYLFTAESGGTVAQIVTAFEHLSGDNNYTIEIRTGNANQVGSVVGRWEGVLGGSAANPVISTIGASVLGSGELNVGQTYWILAIGQGSATGRWFQRETAVTSTYWAQSSNGFQWFLVNSTQLRAMRIVLEGAGQCYANCDVSSAPPILNVDDFTCFINTFAVGQSLPHAQQIGHYANCDGSSTAPVLNVDDFTCFINQFAQGCP
jgi:hypothetical protein